MDAIVLALALVQVTTADGARVFINPEFVTKLYPTKEATQRGPNELVVKGARCVVTLSDGKFLSVLEDCDYLRSLLEQPQPRRR
jgi:hypothetical protein